MASALAIACLRHSPSASRVALAEDELQARPESAIGFGHRFCSRDDAAARRCPPTVTTGNVGRIDPGQSTGLSRREPRVGCKRAFRASVGALKAGVPY
jgi:hypothetical protein